MANKTVEILLDSSGLSVLTIDLFPFGSDTRANGSGDTMTEATNRKGCYQATVTEAITGLHTCHIYDDGTLIKTGVTRFPSDSVGVYRIVPIAMADMVYLYASESNASGLADFVADYGENGYPATDAGVWANSQRTLTAGPSIITGSTQFDTKEISRGNDYSASNQPWIVSLANSPITDLSAYTWTFTAEKSADNLESGDASFTGTVAVTTATGSSRAVRIDVAASVTDSLAVGYYSGALRGTATSGGAKATPVYIQVRVLDDPNQA